MLVPIPWQPELFIHRDMLARLQAVKADMGRDPLLYGENSAWRSYAQQKALWDAYQNGTGNPASNPDTGNRTHMRGVAADLRDTSLAMQRALQRAGLQRDPVEAWHWQLPNWREYPIVNELLKPEDEDDEMKPVIFKRIGGSAEEWSMIAPWIGPNGREVTTDPVRGLAWERMYAKGSGTANNVDRDGYIAAQKEGEVLRQKWVADKATGGSGATPQQIAVAVEAQLADDFAAVRADVNKPRTVQ